MKSMSGRIIGQYEILSLAGVGGMGEVYRARDLTLKREVAIKILPPSFASDSNRVARFRREAQLLASLNHPNIAAIYGFEESATMQCLILEMVPGETVSDMAPRRLDQEEALKICIQIAEALEAAHRKGIIHRDLKPANIKVTPEGQVKVLDFGLAKALTGDVASPDLSQGSTVTDTGTEGIAILGTPAYMAPEQARGKSIDKRTDIWAFGCVLYEMLTGQRAFQAETVSETIAKILEREPDWEKLPKTLPENVRVLLRRCLEKDPNRRLRDIGDGRIELEESLAGRTHPDTVQPASVRVTRKHRIAVLTAAAAAVAALIWYVAGRRDDGPSPKNVAFTQLTDQPGEELYPSLSPDGRSLVYASRSAGNWDIYLQRVGGSNPVNLTKDSPADDTQPAFSPDGERIAFRSERDGGGIFLMGATGENVKRLTDSCYNAAWSPDGKQIVCSSLSFVRPDYRSYNGQLYVVSVLTDEKRLLNANIKDALQPHWSPHGHRITYWGRLGAHQTIWTSPVSGGEPVPLTDGSMDWSPVWSPDGKHIYFSSDRGGSTNLWRIPVEESSGKPVGPPQPVTTPSPYSSYISFSQSGGRMAYVLQVRTSTLHRVNFDPDRKGTTGQPAVVLQSTKEALDPDISPDGQWLTFTSRVPDHHICVVKLDGTNFRQLTNANRNDMPRWSPDGKRIAFITKRPGRERIEAWMVKPDGSDLQQISYLSSGDAVFPNWSPDGSRLALSVMNGRPFLLEVDKPWKEQSPQFFPEFEPGLWFAAVSWSADAEKLAGYAVNPDGTFAGIILYHLSSQRFERLTQSGSVPRWLSDNRRLLFNDEGKIKLLDSSSLEITEILSGAPNEIERRFAVSRDDRVVVFVLKTTESDIWMATSE